MFFNLYSAFVFFCGLTCVIPGQEADLVTTHELGHNFGSEHDPDSMELCAPSEDRGGKYVMYPIAVSGDDQNNKVHCTVLFSLCFVNVAMCNNIHYRLHRIIHCPTILQSFSK